MAKFQIVDGAAGAVQSLFAPGVALANGARIAADYDNGANGDPFCDAVLTLRFDSTAPTARAIAARLYCLHGDGAATQLYPIGGDGTTGADETPQSSLLVGVFQTIAPSTSVAERLQVKRVPLGAFGNRFVLLNDSGAGFHSSYAMAIRPQRYAGV